MFKQRFSCILLLMLLTTLILTPARTVSAAAPIIIHGTYDEDYPLEPSWCPGFTVWDHEVLTWDLTYFLDNAGNLTRTEIHFMGTDTFHNPQNPGAELTGSFVSNAQYDINTWAYIHNSGIPVKITVPGYGVVMMRAGFWPEYPDVHQGGKDSLFDPKDLAAFCSLLAGK